MHNSIVEEIQPDILKRKSNLIWVDNLRVIATISVIVLHVAAPIMYQFGTTSLSNWWVGNIYDSIVRFSVPIFLMISGVLLLSKTYENITEYLKKRLVRILYPFIFWSALYVGKDLFLLYQKGGGSWYEIGHLIFVGIRDGACYHLWYIYLIIGLYLIFPFISRWLNNSNKKEIEYFLILWILSLFLFFPLIKPFVPEIELTYVSGYVGFPILGYYLNRYEVILKGKKWVISLIILGIMFTAMGTYFLSFYKNNFTGWFFGYLTPNVAAVAIGVFVLFKNYWNLDKLNKPIKFISKYSFGIYLVHVLVLTVLTKMGLNYDWIHPIIGIPLVSLICLGISLIIVYFIHKLPLGKYVSGV